MVTAIKHPVPDRVKQSSGHSGALSARMSKITNDGLTQSGAVPYGNTGYQRGKVGAFA